MRQKKTLQQRILAHGLTLPVVLFLLLGSWVLSLVAELSVPFRSSSSWWAELPFRLPDDRRLLLGIGLLLYVAIGFLLIPFNNRLAVIRSRASVQTILFFFGAAFLPFLHPLHYDTFAMLLLQASLLCFLLAYQHPAPMAWVYHAMLFFGLSTCCLPGYLWLLPLYVIGFFLFRLSTLRNFLAAVLGLFFAYLLFGVLLWSVGQPGLFLVQWETCLSFLRYTPPEHVAGSFAFLAYQAVLFLIPAGYYWIKRPQIAVRTSTLLHFFLLTELFLCAGMYLRPDMIGALAPLSLIGSSFVSGHYFTTVSTKFSNVFFLFTCFSAPVVYGLIVWGWQV